MLQRSPTYVVARPAEDPVANKLRAKLPTKLAYHLIRWRNVLLGHVSSSSSRRRKPAKVKQLILGGVRMALGPDYDIATHFTPRYNPWDQRLCLVPDGDLFKAIRDKRASVVTTEIDTFTPKRHQAEGRQRASKPTSSSPPPGSCCRCSAAWRSASTAAWSISPER